MKDASPETREFMNAVIETFELMDLKAEIKSPREFLKER